jgi:hypothetical protein
LGKRSAQQLVMGTELAGDFDTGIVAAKDAGSGFDLPIANGTDIFKVDFRQNALRKRVICNFLRVGKIAVDVRPNTIWLEYPDGEKKQSN